MGCSGSKSIFIRGKQKKRDRLYPKPPPQAAAMCSLST